MQDFKQILKENKIKVTPQRELIYKELLKLDHPSADIVFSRVKETFPNISYDTVYRALLTFSEIGIVDVVEGYGEPKRFDTNVGRHHHFRCLNCNKIIDIYGDYFDDLVVPEELSEKYNLIKTKVILEGICEDCKKKK